MSENKQDAARKKQAREGDLMHNMLTKGATLELEVNSKAGEWKPRTYVYNPTSGAIEGRDPKGALLSYITLRRFSYTTNAPENPRFHIKTPNKMYHLRVTNLKDKPDWMDWLEYMQREQRLFDSQARMFTELPSNVAAMEGIAGAINKDKDRPAYWIPKEESVYCCRCGNTTGWRVHTCRDCGFIFCSSTECFLTDPVRKCMICLNPDRDDEADLAASLSHSFNQSTGEDMTTTPTKMGPSQSFAPSPSSPPGPSTSTQLQQQFSSSPSTSTPTTTNLASPNKPATTTAFYDISSQQTVTIGSGKPTNRPQSTTSEATSTPYQRSVPRQSQGNVNGNNGDIHQHTLGGDRASISDGERREQLQALKTHSERVDMVVYSLLLLGLIVWIYNTFIN